ncbi:hypothetical protein FGK63_03465 [Ruegeria sediminis]|uniref:Uncharacterized protein n=1 Tax=Ruegeria sediminis TaxID=2583820 RepID=A0ABY2X414_9RHOB|nr:hypothetical protein [Ruegeria sediminis]TMV10132.1 hypothetical protein FGK63_03465 [Ruegeria sediminis]
MDYFDKLRVSLWLWRLYWRKGNHNITPNFHVDERVGVADRIVLVGMYPNSRAEGISPVGYQTKAFMTCPTVIGMFIKNFFILSVSSQALLTDRFGLTGPVKNTADLEEGKVGRRFIGNLKYHSLEPLFYLDGMRFFSFGSHSPYVSGLNNYIFVDESRRARIPRPYEEFRIPLIEKSVVKSKILAQLNVHELQLASLKEYDRMNIANSERRAIERSKDQLEAIIRGDRLMLDATSPLIIPRRKIVI